MSKKPLLIIGAPGAGKTTYALRIAGKHMKDQVRTFSGDFEPNRHMITNLKMIIVEEVSTAGNAYRMMKKIHSLCKKIEKPVPVTIFISNYIHPNDLKVDPFSDFFNVVQIGSQKKKGGDQ